MEAVGEFVDADVFVEQAGEEEKEAGYEDHLQNGGNDGVLPAGTQCRVGGHQHVKFHG